MALDGFDLHAALTILAQQEDGRLPLEKLLRYYARPPIAQDRLSTLQNGRVVLELKTPWHDGSTHVIYEPLDFVAKLDALIPRPHKNLILYHGVLSGNAAWRSRVVAYGRAQSRAHVAAHTTAPGGAPAETRAPESVKPARRRRRQWAELMRRAFGYDLLPCPNCGGKMELLAVIFERTAIRKILCHLGLPSEPPAITRARASPDPHLPFDHVA